jgi:hypothetical protein
MRVSWRVMYLYGILVHYHLQKDQITYPNSNILKALLYVLCSCTYNYQMYLLLVCCKRWLPHPQLHRVVGLFSFKLLTLLFSDFVEHMCHKVLVNCCLVAPATVFPGSNACFSGLVTFLNAENLRAAFIIAFIFSQSNSYYNT